MSVIARWQQRLASLEVPLAVSSNTLLSSCLTNLIDKGRLSEDVYKEAKKRLAAIGVDANVSSGHVW